MPPAARARRRARGEVEVLESGSFRVKVYAGRDALTGKRNYLTEVVPAGARAAREAERVRTRLLTEVDEQRNPRTNATVDQLLARYLEVVSVEASTRQGYEGAIRNHIGPGIGSLTLAKITGETLDSFYADLLRCRARCSRRRYVEHRVDGEHACDDRCVPHQCRPLAPATVRQIHMVLNGAFSRAVRWRWIGTNPAQQAQAPAAPPPNPRPPSCTQAAQIAMDAWTDPDWGMFVWLAMTTGARRGELCALRWDRLDFGTAVLDIRTSLGQVKGRVWEKDTKTHQRRRIVLDPQTLALLRAYLQVVAGRAASIEADLPADAFMFANTPDGLEPLKLDSVTQRYSRMCRRLGLKQHLHQLRHYSATELIAAGVDVRTVAGRLGHGGGGTTTLRVYSAWVAEADQRAAHSLGARMPELPVAAADDGGLLALPAPEVVVEREDLSPYLQIAEDLRGAIRCGALTMGESLPTVKSLAERYSVSVGTAHRAIAVLTASGEVDVSRGRRAVVSGAPADGPR